MAEATNDKSALGVGSLDAKGCLGTGLSVGRRKALGAGSGVGECPRRPRTEEASALSALSSLVSRKGLGSDGLQDLRQFTGPRSKMSRMKALGLRK